MTEADRALLTSAMQSAKARAVKSGKGWVAMAEVNCVLDAVYSGKVYARIIDEATLVVYTFSTPWWNPDRLVVAELLVLALQPGRSVDRAVWWLKQVATATKADAIEVATALAASDRALSRLYGRHGFVQTSTGLTLTET